jgi:hypothetical protein
MPIFYRFFLTTIGLGLLASNPVHAQLGIKLSGASPATPQTSLDVNGAITSRPTTLTVTGNTATIPTNVGQVVLTPATTGGPTADITLSTAAAPFAGQILFLVNNTAQRALLNGVPVNAGQAMVFTGDAASSSYKSATGGAVGAASNGLTATSSNVKLGGPLTANTEVATGTSNGTNNFTLTGKGFLGLGMLAGTTPSSKFHIVTEASGGGTEDDYIFDDYATSAGGLSNHLLLRTSRGSIASPTSSVNGDQLGGITFAPRTGTGTGTLNFSGSELYGFYKGDGTTLLTDLRFNTSGAEKMRLDENGHLGIGTTSPKSTLEVNGSFGANYLNVTTATYTLLTTDFYVSYNGTAAGTLTLPSGLNVKGRLYTIKNNTAAQALTLNTSSSETINGLTSLSIPAGQSVQVVTTGASTGLATYEIVDFSAATTAPALASASNGLTATSGNVKLGGTLTANTDIASSGFDLTFSGTGQVAIGTTTTNGVLHVSGAMGSNSFTSGLNITNTTGKTANSTLSITPGYAGTGSGTTTAPMATYDLPGLGNHIFGDNVIPDGDNVNSLGNATNRWNTVYGTTGRFGAMFYGQSGPGTSGTAAPTDYFTVTQAPITYTLPAAASNKGRAIVIYAYGGTTTLTVASGGLFDPTNFTGTATNSYSLAQYHRITLFCDGNNWIATSYL